MTVIPDPAKYKLKDSSMFAIYDIQGQRFRDTLERLQKVKRIPASQKTLFQPEYENKSLQNFLTSQRSNNTATSLKAKQAYQEMIQSPKQEAILHAYQIMSQPVATVQSTQDVVIAWQRLHQLHYQQLPVLDKAHRIVSIVSARDLLQFLILNDQKVSYVAGKTVADAMSADVITSDPITDVRRIAKVMTDYHLTAIPIVDASNSLIGLVSRTDILRAVAGNPPLSLWS